jgi:lipopolysaccharide export system protein LptC
VFRAAARHSRFVRFLRLAIPIGISLVVAVLVVATFFNPFKLITAFPIDPGHVSLSGTKIVMEAPHLTGFTTDARPYEITARAAAQDMTKPGFLELQDITAHIDMKDGQKVKLKAENGLYDTKADVLKLSDHIVLVTDSGYEARLSEATVNMGSGHIESDHPVNVKLLNGWLNSNHLEILNNGEAVRFTGDVELTLNPEKPAQPAAPSVTHPTAYRGQP